MFYYTLDARDLRMFLENVADFGPFAACLLIRANDTPRLPWDKGAYLIESIWHGP